MTIEKSMYRIIQEMLTKNRDAYQGVSVELLDQATFQGAVKFGKQTQTAQQNQPEQAAQAMAAMSMEQPLPAETQPEAVVEQQSQTAAAADTQEEEKKEEEPAPEILEDQPNQT